MHNLDSSGCEGGSGTDWQEHELFSFDLGGGMSIEAGLGGGLCVGQGRACCSHLFSGKSDFGLGR